MKGVCLNVIVLLLLDLWILLSRFIFPSSLHPVWPHVLIPTSIWWIVCSSINPTSTVTLVPTNAIKDCRHAPVSIIWLSLWEFRASFRSISTVHGPAGIVSINEMRWQLGSRVSETRVQGYGQGIECAGRRLRRKWARFENVSMENDWICRCSDQLVLIAERHYFDNLCFRSLQWEAVGVEGVRQKKSFSKTKTFWKNNFFARDNRSEISCKAHVKEK